jgi:hypothetical protein
MSQVIKNSVMQPFSSKIIVNWQLTRRCYNTEFFFPLDRLCIQQSRNIINIFCSCSKSRAILISSPVLGTSKKFSSTLSRIYVGIGEILHIFSE